MTAQQDVVLLFGEIEYRAKIYKITRKAAVETVDERYRQDCAKISDAFIASADERKAAILAEAGVP